MKKELEQKFYDRWPEWFRGRSEGMGSNLMCFGFEHEDGWFDLEWRLCEDLEKILNGTNYKLLQVKEKFGSLRWYYQIFGEVSDDVVKAVDQRVNQAEDESAKTCEVCGKPGRIGGRRWLSCLCEECRHDSAT